MRPRINVVLIRLRFASIFTLHVPLSIVASVMLAAGTPVRNSPGPTTDPSICSRLEGTGNLSLVSFYDRAGADAGWFMRLDPLGLQLVSEKRVPSGTTLASYPPCAVDNSCNTYTAWKQSDSFRYRMVLTSAASRAATSQLETQANRRGSSLSSASARGLKGTIHAQDPK